MRFNLYKGKTPTTTNIFSDKIAFTLWEAESPDVIVIKNKELNENYKSYFETLWRIAEP